MGLHFELLPSQFVVYSLIFEIDKELILKVTPGFRLPGCTGENIVWSLAARQLSVSMVSMKEGGELKNEHYFLLTRTA